MALLKAVGPAEGSCGRRHLRPKALTAGRRSWPDIQPRAQISIRSHRYPNPRARAATDAVGPNSNPGHRSHRYPNPRACAVAKHGFLIDSTPSLLHLYRTKLSRRVSRRVSTRRVLSCALFLFAVCRRGRACCPSVLQIHDAAHGERSSCCKLDVTGH